MERRSNKHEPSPTQDQTSTWSEHEHLAAPLQTRAQDLLAEAGSPELAKHALEVAASEQQGIGPSYLDGLAERWGFRSRNELLGASISMAATDGGMWWVTPLGNRGWVAWTQRDQRMSDILSTVEAARKFVGDVAVTR